MIRSSYVRGDNPVYVFGSLLEQRTFGPQNFAIDSLNAPNYLTNIKNSLDIDMPLFMGFESVNEENIRRLGIAQAQEQFAGADQQVRFSAVDGYLLVLAKQASVRALGERIQSAKSEVEDARRLNAKGLVLGSDFYAAQAILSSLLARQVQALSELDSARARLDIMMGDTAQGQDLSGSLASVEYKVDSDDALVARALSTRRDLKEADISVATAKVGAGQANRSFLPKVEAFASVETNTEDFDSNPTNRTVGVRSNFPIGDPAYFSRKSRAKAAEQAAKGQRDTVEENIRMEVSESLRRFEGAKASLAMVQDAVQQAEKSLNLFRPLYREGRQSILEVLRAEDGLFKAQAALFENLYQIHSGYARLQLVTGSLESASIHDIQKNLEAQP